MLTGFSYCVAFYLSSMTLTSLLPSRSSFPPLSPSFSLFFFLPPVFPRSLSFSPPPLGQMFSWGDGDYGKLGRGGSEGCKVPKRVEIPGSTATTEGGSGAPEEVIKVFCGAQSSFALTRSGAIYSWGKGDLHRLGHGSEEHVR